MHLTYKHTILASYVGYLTQAITINFTPLLFITFEKSYGITMGKLSLLIAISFLTQLTADLLAAKFARRVNPRAFSILAHVFAVLGMTGYAWLPQVMPTPYGGIVLSVMISAVGGGIIEVLISPIVEACPTDEKSTSMSLLHSFYCWGMAAIVLFSTLFFTFVGIEHWRILACLWAIVPALGALAFCFVPIYPLEQPLEISHGEAPPSLLRSGIFWIFFIMMFSAGAAEQAMSQWASSFAESGLGVSKAMGDLLGPCAFAILMGISRLVYGKSGGRINLSRFIELSSILCIISYLLAALSPSPILSLVGCALCGLAVGILWPGTYSLATARMPWGGLRMFALLAMAGDVGCLMGPTAAGWIAEAFGNNLRISFLVSLVFPILILLMIYLGLRRVSKTK